MGSLQTAERARVACPWIWLGSAPRRGAKDQPFPDGLTAAAGTLQFGDPSPEAADEDSADAGKEDAGKGDSCCVGSWLRHFEDKDANAHVDQ